MPKQPPANLPASVQARLMTRIRSEGLDPMRTFKLYALERFLYRLSQSEFRDRFILKGAMLFALWDLSIHRPTQDLDLLGRGEMSVETLRLAFEAICQAQVETDGLRFDPESIDIADIRAEDEYVGKRVNLMAFLGSALIPIQVDIGVGDAVAVPFKRERFPVWLDFPAPRILAYTREPMIAEKFHAMTTLGIRNSRMKDYFDLWTLSRHFSFDASALHLALETTFSRRKTPWPSQMPLGLTAEFGQAVDKKLQWQGFLKRTGILEPVPFPEVVRGIAEFLRPVLFPSNGDGLAGLSWPPGGPWNQR